MSEETKQTVVETEDATAQPVADKDNAQDKGDDFESALAEFDASLPKDEAQSVPDTAAAEKSSKRLEELEKRIEQREFQADMQNVIGKVRGDMDSSVFDDVLVEAWVDAQARREPKLQRAWVNRHSDPKAFDKVVGELGKRFSKRYANMPDKAATEDREAVTQAVRGASTKASDNSGAPNYSNMSDSEFREAVKKQHGFTPV